MADIEIRKAERYKAKLRLALAGPSGAGKTMSSLKLAKSIAGPNGKVCIIDTERGSGDLYANLFDYDIIQLSPPFKVETYTDAITAAEKAGYEVIIIDSLTHAWSDEGGLLDQADKMQAAGKNRFTLWADLTPQHRSLVNAMLNSPKHIIATIRSKQEYGMEKDEKTGKQTVKKLGMAPIQRDGMEYEFTVFMDIDQNHSASASKDRTNMFKNEFFVIDEKVGERLLGWLNEGKDRPDPDVVAAERRAKQAIITTKQKIMELCKRLGFITLATDSEGVKADITKFIKSITRDDYTSDLPIEQLAVIRDHLSLTVDDRGRTPAAQNELIPAENLI